MIIVSNLFAAAFAYFTEMRRSQLIKFLTNKNMKVKGLI